MCGKVGTSTGSLVSCCGGNGQASLDGIQRTSDDPWSSEEAVCREIHRLAHGEGRNRLARIACGVADPADVIQDIAVLTVLRMREKTADFADRHAIRGWLFGCAWKIVARIRRGRSVPASHAGASTSNAVLTRALRIPRQSRGDCICEPPKAATVVSRSRAAL